MRLLAEVDEIDYAKEEFRFVRSNLIRRCFELGLVLCKALLLLFVICKSPFNGRAWRLNVNSRGLGFGNNFDASPTRSFWDESRSDAA